MLTYELFVLLGLVAVPIGTGLSLVIATIYYNRNYYLETKIKYFQEKAIYLKEKNKYK